MTTTLSVELVPLDDLRPDPANPRRISEDELDALERSLRQFGFVQPVLARRDDQTVIGGHRARRHRLDRGAARAGRRDRREGAAPGRERGLGMSELVLDLVRHYGPIVPSCLGLPTAMSYQR